MLVESLQDEGRVNQYRGKEAKCFLIRAVKIWLSLTSLKQTLAFFTSPRVHFLLFHWTLAMLLQILLLKNIITEFFLLHKVALLASYFEDHSGCLPQYPLTNTYARRRTVGLFHCSPLTLPVTFLPWKVHNKEEIISF